MTVPTVRPLPRPPLRPRLPIRRRINGTIVQRQQIISDQADIRAVICTARSCSLYSQLLRIIRTEINLIDTR